MMLSSFSNMITGHLCIFFRGRSVHWSICNALKSLKPLKSPHMILLCFRCSFTFCMFNSCTVLVLTFKTLIHLGLIFLYDIQYKEVHLILLHVDALFSQNHLLGSWLFHLKIIWHAYKELFLDCPIIHFSTCLYSCQCNTVHVILVWLWALKSEVIRS